MWSDNKVKDWESRYDPKRHIPNRGPRAKLPKLESLPAGRWVLFKPASLPDDYISIEKSVMPWIKENKLKLQGRILVNTSDDDEKVAVRAEAFVFKKTKDAVLFKLTWG